MCDSTRHYSLQKTEQNVYLLMQYNNNNNKINLYLTEIYDVGVNLNMDYNIDHTYEQNRLLPTSLLIWFSLSWFHLSCVFINLINGSHIFKSFFTKVHSTHTLQYIKY